MAEILEFTIPTEENREQLLNELVEITTLGDVPLGRGNQENLDISEHIGRTKQFQKLQTEQVAFSPKLDIYQIGTRDFLKKNIEMTTELRAKLKSHNFYNIRIPITLMPRSGWAFTRLECRISFNLEESVDHLPIIYDIFPDDHWVDILKLSDQFKIGLDENLQFCTQLALSSIQLGNLGANAQAKIKQEIGGGLDFSVGPFSYTLRRNQVRSRGRLNSDAFWRLDGNQWVDDEDVMLGLILMVPKTRELPVHAYGEVRVRHDIQFLQMDVKDFHLREAIKAFVNGGASLATTSYWHDILRNIQ